MLITKLEALPVRVPMRGRVTIASGVLTCGNHVVIRVHTDGGLIGLGEASPIASTDADTQASIVTAVHERIAPRLMGLDPCALPQLQARLETALPGNYCAKAGVDIALHDLAGKVLGVPVYQLLGGRAHDAITNREIDLWIDEPNRMAEAARAAYAEGVRTFEIKIGTDLVRDVEWVRAVRKATGPQALLRVDCNDGYSAGTALPALRRMEAPELQYIEQPLPRWDMEGMAALASALDTPICADQGAYTLHDVFRLLRHSAADLVCIKIGRSGLAGAAQMQAICEAAGVRCTMGSMLPLGIGAAAIHHFGVHARNVDWRISGIYGSPMDYYTADVVRGTTLDQDGVVRLTEAPGLGVELDEAALARFAAEASCT